MGISSPNPPKLVLEMLRGSFFIFIMNHLQRFELFELFASFKSNTTLNYQHNAGSKSAALMYARRAKARYRRLAVWGFFMNVIIRCEGPWCLSWKSSMMSDSPSACVQHKLSPAYVIYSCFLKRISILKPHQYFPSSSLSDGKTQLFHPSTLTIFLRLARDTTWAPWGGNWSPCL